MNATDTLKATLDGYSSRPREEVIAAARDLLRRSLYSRDNMPDLSQLNEQQTRTLCELAMFYIGR